MYDIESFFTKILLDFVRGTNQIKGTYSYKIYYRKPLEIFYTIDLVILLPFLYLDFYHKYVLTNKNCFSILLYDNETDLILGEIIEIPFNQYWKKNIQTHLPEQEHRIESCICPKCDFWLVERINKKGQKFIGCSNFPVCTYVKSLKK